MNRDIVVGGTKYYILDTIDISSIITSSISEYLFLSSTQFLFNGSNLPFHSIINPEWIVVPSVLTVPQQLVPVLKL